MRFKNLVNKVTIAEIGPIKAVRDTPKGCEYGIAYAREYQEAHKKFARASGVHKDGVSENIEVFLQPLKTSWDPKGIAVINPKNSEILGFVSEEAKPFALAKAPKLKRKWTLIAPGRMHWWDREGIYMIHLYL